MLTGDPINLFLDRDNLVWGDDWRPKIDGSLSSVAFFIPIITPRYFKSAECRRELNFFARSAERLGIKELVLPILYVDFPGLQDDPPADDLIALVRRFQWVDWGERKFDERGSGACRRAVSELAQRLVDANRAAEQAASQGVILAGAEALEDEEELGSLDKLGIMETAIPDLSETIVEIGRTIEQIGAAMSTATSEITTRSAQGSALAARLAVTRQLAEKLVAPAEHVRDLGNDFASSLHDVDEGVRILIERAPEEAVDKESQEQFLSFFDSVRSMVAQSEQGFAAVQSMIDSMAPIEKMSRDLRGPLKTLRQGLTLLVDGLSVMRSWVSLIDSAVARFPELKG